MQFEPGDWIVRKEKILKRMLLKGVPTEKINRAARPVQINRITQHANLLERMTVDTMDGRTIVILRRSYRKATEYEIQKEKVMGIFIANEN